MAQGVSYGRMSHTSLRDRIKSAPRALVWLLVAFNLGVLAFMISAAFKASDEVFDSPWSLPENWLFENWSQAWVESGFGRAVLVTGLLVGAASVSIIVIAAPAAYMLARIGTRTASRLTFTFTLGIGLPAQVIVIPLFVMMSRVGLIDNLFGLYIVYTALGLPFAVFLLTGFFRSLPVDLEEAATLDGAGLMRTFFQVMLPLARSGIITALILSMLFTWNETLVALVFIQTSDNNTLSLALLSFLGTVQYGSGGYGVLFAGACIVVLPTLAVYVWLGRRIIEGMTLGAGK